MMHLTREENSQSAIKVTAIIMTSTSICHGYRCCGTFLPSGSHCGGFGMRNLKTTQLRYIPDTLVNFQQSFSIFCTITFIFLPSNAYQHHTSKGRTIKNSVYIQPSQTECKFIMGDIRSGSKLDLLLNVG